MQGLKDNVNIYKLCPFIGREKMQQTRKQNGKCRPRRARKSCHQAYDELVNGEQAVEPHKDLRTMSTSTSCVHTWEGEDAASKKVEKKVSTQESMHKLPPGI